MFHNWKRAVPFLGRLEITAKRVLSIERLPNEFISQEIPKPVAGRLGEDGQYATADFFVS